MALPRAFTRWRLITWPWIWFAPSKIYTIFEGTSEIQRLVTARAISGLHIR
ncbi:MULTISPECIES: acyl-CoA dehydrogenase domain-containing protein [Pseudofrankia]|uniref:acyl-CoA dehydrogenase domain-containing protein n=1 Tax=Pseudofrankia TaxID=2994363 RepID=UPI000234BF28|nr:MULTISPECIES: acyl-CoA dehydrogenase domain-containing protein [Pseudofrankia]